MNLRLLSRRTTGLELLSGRAMKTAEPVKHKELLGTPNVVIDPGIRSAIEEAVNRLKAINSNYFSNVSDIIGTTGHAYGAEQDNVVYVNLSKIQDQVDKDLGDRQVTQEEYKEILIKTVMSVLAHEVGHADSDVHGEGPAEAEEARIVNLIKSK